MIEIVELMEYLETLPENETKRMISNKLTEIVSSKTKTHNKMYNVKRTIDRLGRKEVCLKTGISYPQMSAWLGGAGYLSKPKREALSRLLGVEI